MKDNFRYMSKRVPGKFTLLNSGRHTERLDAFGVGRMSYPNFGGWDKPLHIPDVRLLARLAEEAGLDLRIIVLMRQANELLQSTVHHRRFGPEQRQATILGLSASALAAQLWMIDPRFFVCVNSSTLVAGDPTTWTTSSSQGSRRGVANTNLQELLAVDDTTVKTASATLAAEMHAYTQQKGLTNIEPVLSAVAHEHLAAMVDVLMDVCGI
jgi:hypothetical protein